MSNKQILRIGHLKITDHLILGITKAKLQKETETFQYADIETIPMTGWNDIGDALISEEIDIAFMLAPYAMELYHSGIKINLLLFSHKSGSIIVTNKNAHIEKLEDFKGKTVLIPYHLSVHHMLFDKMLREKGLEPGVDKDVVFEVVAPSQIPEIIEWDKEGNIGGYIVAEPFGTQVIASGLGNEFALSKDIWPNHPCCAVIVRDEIHKNNPDALHELIKSLVKSGKLIESKPDVASKIGSVFLSQPVDVINTVLTAPPDRISTEHLLPVLEDLDLIQNYLTSNISAMSGKIDLEKFVDLSYAKEAGAT